jgi:hypothetical protein
MKRYFLFLILAALLAPQGAEALSVFVEQPTRTVRAGDTVLLSVFANTEGKEINSIDGDIVLPSSATVSAITVGGSAFSLWPAKPSLSGNRISFAGGSISGIEGPKIKLFTISLTAAKAGTLTIASENTAGYLSDGSGTKISGTAGKDSIVVSAAGTEASNGLAELILSDTTPPERFAIELGRDPQSYDGKYFISFQAEDKDSGIQRYEVKEEGFPLVRSGSPYVLQDQSLRSPVEVYAIDLAGNVRVETDRLKAGIEWGKVMKIAIPILAALILAVLFRRKLIRLSA